MVRRRIAIVGAGISGLVTAYLLQRQHEVTVFEANDYIGGHTNTVDVEGPDGHQAIDTGFIVFNPESYPNFVQLLRRLDVGSQKTSMTFSVSSDRSGLEYGGGGLQRMFAQRRNLLRPAFHRMLLEIRRFYREAPELLQGDDSSTTIGEYVERKGFSRDFVEDHLMPFGAAIWSASTQDMYAFPARFFVEFFANHGFLRLQKPEWRVVSGGSRQYIGPLTSSFRDRIRSSTPVHRVTRTEHGVDIETRAGIEHFDEVVLAVHSDLALRLLSDPTPAETEILSAMGYQENKVLLHTDITRLPATRRAWSSWNYRIPKQTADQVTVTYNMNMLQGLQTAETYCVTLNECAAINPTQVLREFTYHHPRYTLEFVAAQKRHDDISGVRRTHYCGACWGYGFHEDGVVSALQVARQFGETL
jgi:uncharacterized protein